MRPSLLPALSLLFVACVPAPIDETGLRCALPDRGCGPGFACIQGFCARGPGGGQVLLARGEQWRFWDAPAPPPSDWAQPSFDDSGWKQGAAPLGYGQPTIVTALDYGPDANDKTPTAYFRRHFTLERVDASARLELIRDDGGVVYVNGTEVLRTKMPAGAVTHTTLAEFTGSAEEQVAVPAVVPTSALRAGDNVVAVEIHQATAGSDDLEMDLSLQL